MDEVVAGPAKTNIEKTNVQNIRKPARAPVSEAMGMVLRV
jgi:hypothetical protein